MPKILFLLPYPMEKAPSQRFRVELFFQVLNAQKIDYKVRSFIDKKTWIILYDGKGKFAKSWGVIKGLFKRVFTLLFQSWRYNYVFIHREAAPIGPPVFEWILSKLMGKKIIYDFDDAIWIPNTSTENKSVSWLKASWKVKYICKWAYKVVGGNDYLCAFAKQYNKNVIMIPSCVDTVYGHSRLKDHQTGKPVVGWTGSHSSLQYLENIVPIIKELQRNYEFCFAVIADKKPLINLDDWVFIPWNADSETDDLLKIDIGLMYLPVDAWSEGKCGFKLIQYLSLGIPAIASPVGVNKIIVEQGINGYLCDTAMEWKAALLKLLTDVSLRKKMGLAGRRKILQQYSIASQEIKYLGLFN